MPFGLSNALANFQEYVNKILAEKLDIFIIIYLDNIMFFTLRIRDNFTLRPYNEYLINSGSILSLPT